MTMKHTWLVIKKEENIVKLNRKILRRLILEAINETQIKPSIPGISDSDYEKSLALARHPDLAVRQQVDHLADAMGYEGSFSGDIGAYDDPVTRETVGVSTPQGKIEKEVVIPRDLVDAVVDVYQLILKVGETDPNDPDYDLTYDFKDAAQEIFSHIERDVQPDHVYAYGLKVRGYRAKEYNDAMNAVGEYL